MYCLIGVFCSALLHFLICSQKPSADFQAAKIDKWKIKNKTDAKKHHAPFTPLHSALASWREFSFLPLERNDDNARRRFDGDCIRTVAIWVITAEDLLHNAIECVGELDMFFQYVRWSLWIQWRFIHCFEICELNGVTNCSAWCYAAGMTLTCIFGRCAFRTVNGVIHRSTFSCSLLVSMHMGRWPWRYISNTSGLKSIKACAQINRKRDCGSPACTYPSCYIILRSCIASTGLILLILRYDA